MDNIEEGKDKHAKVVAVIEMTKDEAQQIAFEALRAIATQCGWEHIKDLIGRELDITDDMIDNAVALLFPEENCCSKDIMEKIVEDMAEEGSPMIELSELFINEPLSLEILLMLEDKDNMTIEQISNGIADNVNATDNVNVIGLLDRLKGFKAIVIKDDLVNIAYRGQCIVTKLRMSTIKKDFTN